MSVPTPETDIALYTAGTPNGQKVAIALEELDLKYETIPIDLLKNGQKEDWYLKINPNGKIPAIVDRTPISDERRSLKQAEKRVFDGQAILMWLTQKYDKNYKICYPYDTDRYWEVVQWLSWMQSGIGPMQGQASHFFGFAPEKIEYAIKRFQDELKRLYSVLEARLAFQQEQNKTVAGGPASEAGVHGLINNDEGPWIVGDKMTIADIACFSWINWAEKAGIDVNEFKEISGWLKRINDRPAVKKGLAVPEKLSTKEKI